MNSQLVPDEEADTRRVSLKASVLDSSLKRKRRLPAPMQGILRRVHREQEGLPRSHYSS